MHTVEMGRENENIRKRISGNADRILMAVS